MVSFKNEITIRKFLIWFIGLSAIPMLSLKGEEGTVSLHPVVKAAGSNRIFHNFTVPEQLFTTYDSVPIKVAAARDDIIFPDGRKEYCINEAPFIITGINSENIIGSFSIEGDGGLTDNHDNTATVYPELLSEGNYDITYTYILGRVHRVTKTLTIRNVAFAGFTWENECFQAGQAIHFNDNSLPNGETITEYKWLFYKGTDSDSLMERNVAYTFSQPGNYMVSLHIETSNGCIDTTARIFGLKPVIALAGQTYFEDFEDGPVTWQRSVSLQKTTDSWTLGEPLKGFDGASSGDSCWFTYIEDFSAPQEQSWISSPCFDFTDTERPMIKFDIWRLFDGTRDGAVLQATSDSGKTWQNVGSLQDGINWFNADNILGYPGNQYVGWSDIRDDDWIESRHDLDGYSNKTQVQFRIAYGSDGTARNTDGLAFDNVWIGERNKVVLLEHFTNMSDPASVGPDQMVNELVSNNMENTIDLQYHTSYPGSDLFNEQNPYVPDTRLLYYGLSGVPYSILDGGSIGQHRFDYDLNPLNEEPVIIQSLNNSKFNITISSYVSGNSLHVGAVMSALQNISSRELTLHLAVTEQQIEGVTGDNGETIFHSVVKTMLPDAGGTTFYQAWNKDELQHVEYTWDMEHVYDLEELRIVAFIQDEETKEIYQASLNTVEIQTGTDSPKENHQDIPDYWTLLDPAYSQVKIRFKEPLNQNVKLELYNNLGSMVRSENLPAGSILAEFSLADWPDGIYLIRLSDDSQVIGTSKLVISR